MEFWALYLPAYHRIIENDKWWGTGFTEWDNVKKGKPLYFNHVQPQVPLNGYYDLSKVETLEAQAELAAMYGVTGFIFYHYWFQNGKLLLQKPAENLLINKDIKVKYSFCWANEPWTRSWDGKNKDILMPQEYGSKEEWIKHIKYLIPFFKDSRYQKIDGRPVMYIYSASRIICFDEMIDCWNTTLKQNGLNELYIIEFISTFNKDIHGCKTNAVLEFEPLYTTRFDITITNKIKRVLCKFFNVTDYQDYDQIWRYILKRNRIYSDKLIIKSCFCAWDNSPRKGKNSMIIKNSSPEKFEKYLYQLIQYDRENTCNNIIVINAWNEWGEGAFLEPSKYHEYRYLESIKNVLTKYNYKTGE